ncbi:MAG TPA: hypothetical protein VIH76_03705 [Candidatus Acidoferrales bacterium]
MPNFKYLLANWSGALTEARRAASVLLAERITLPWVGLSLFRLISSCPSEVIID